MGVLVQSTTCSSSTTIQPVTVKVEVEMEMEMVVEMVVTITTKDPSQPVNRGSFLEVNMKWCCVGWKIKSK